MALRLYNSLSRKIEEFRPQNPDSVSMYTCGPTVYDYVTIGNFRTYTLSDFVYRVLRSNGYKIKYIMNITDVGHLTGDNEGDSSLGEDRMEIAATKEGRSAKEVANFYTQQFLKDFENLGLIRPERFTKATEHIRDQIELVEELVQKGYTYETSDGLYFDTSKFPDYGKLSGMTKENVLEGARVEINPERKNPTDFALWKFSPKNQMRWMEWNSPWGRGFPGWHIECSAMSMKYLGESIDIHVGGEDLKMTHHQNEVAQSECATGKTFVNYWIHGAFLLVDGGRMGKSLGNAYTLSDIETKGFSPLALRYFYTTAHYRSKLNFTWEGLLAAQNALKKLYDLISSYQDEKDAVLALDYFDAFNEAVSDDINIPKAVSVMWDMLKSEVPESSKIATMLRFDEILGFDVENYIGFEIPQNVIDVAKVRSEYRKNGIWDKADQLRRDIENMGFVIEDVGSDYKIKRKI